MQNALKLFSVSIILFFAACAPKRIDMPSYEGRDIKEFMAEKASISEIETTFSILFEKNETEIRGEGALNIFRDGDMSMRIYSLGFLAMELTSREGVVRSTPRIDRNKSVILTQGLRDCLFWWDMKDFVVQEEGDLYLLKDHVRSLWIDRKTFLPVRQKIPFDDGKELTIYYDVPAKENGIWYQSRMRIELLQYVVTLTVKNFSPKN